MTVLESRSPEWRRVARVGRDHGRRRAAGAGACARRMVDSPPEDPGSPGRRQRSPLAADEASFRACSISACPFIVGWRPRPCFNDGSRSIDEVAGQDRRAGKGCRAGGHVHTGRGLRRSGRRRLSGSAVLCCGSDRRDGQSWSPTKTWASLLGGGVHEPFRGRSRSQRARAAAASSTRRLRWGKNCTESSTKPSEAHRRGRGPRRRGHRRLALRRRDLPARRPLAQVPTTLLAMVDASVGQGGVDFRAARTTWARSISRGSFWPTRVPWPAAAARAPHGAAE